jgi:hypothetical protein
MNLSVRGFKIRERRTTRNMGVDKTAHRRVIKGLILPPNHQFSDEPILYRRFMDGIRAIPGAGQVPGKPWISSNNGSFYTKLVLYKDMFKRDPVRHIFPLTTATTPSTAIRDLREFLTSNSHPITFFLEQQEDSMRDSEGHCSSIFIWKTDEGRQMVFRDSNSGSFAKVSSWTREIAKSLKIDTINLIPTTTEDRSSNDQCVDLAYLAIAE